MWEGVLPHLISSPPLHLTSQNRYIFHWCHYENNIHNGEVTPGMDAEFSTISERHDGRHAREEAECSAYKNPNTGVGNPYTDDSYAVV